MSFSLEFLLARANIRDRFRIMSGPRPGLVLTNAPPLSQLDTRLNRDEVRVDYPIRLLARPEKRVKNATFTQPGSDVAQTNL